MTSPSLRTPSKLTDYPPRDTYIQALKDNSVVVAKNVTANLLDRHMKPLFL